MVSKEGDLKAPKMAKDMLNSLANEAAEKTRKILRDLCIPIFINSGRLFK